MDNPFEMLDQKLNKIILLMEKRPETKEPAKISAEKDIMNLDETAAYLGCSKSTLYGYTSARKIPHFKVQKRILFRKQDLVDWISDGRVKTRWEIEKEANDYLVKRKKRY